MRPDTEDRVDIPVGSPEPEWSDLRRAARVIVAGDIQDAGSADDLRHRLATAFRDGTGALGQRWEDVEDGLRLVLSPDVAALPAVLDSFVNHVAGCLGDGDQVRLSVHFGFLDRTAGVWSGTPLVHARRLVNAAEARQRLRDTGHARLAVVVSEYVHWQIVRRRCTGARPEAYQRIMVIENETMAPAWLRVI